MNCLTCGRAWIEEAATIQGGNKSAKISIHSLKANCRLLCPTMSFCDTSRHKKNFHFPQLLVEDSPKILGAKKDSGETLPWDRISVLVSSVAAGRKEQSHSHSPRPLFPTKAKALSCWEWENKFCHSQGTAKNHFKWGMNGPSLYP